MEKIYEENNQQKNESKFKQTMKAKVPHHFSAFLILVAFATFLTVVVRNNQSYAMTEQEFGTEFQTYGLEDSNTLERSITAKDTTTSEVLPNEIIYYVAQNYNVAMFCVDKSVGGPTPATLYKKGSTELDDGVVYILRQKDKLNGITNEYAKYWITQYAIYFYQNAKSGGQKYTGDTAADLDPDKINKMNQIIVKDNSKQSQDPGAIQSISIPTNSYDNYIKGIVEKAMNNPNTRLSITKASDNSTVTSDNKYYKSPIITINGLLESSTYSLKATNAPEGTKYYTSSGKEITGNLSAIDTSDNQIYLLVPIDKVTEKTKTITLSVTGPQSVAYQYEAANLQPLTTLLDDNVMKGIDLVYTPSVPDTSMSAAQSIYFIGLVILLCGLGIIYANAKPKTTEE